MGPLNLGPYFRVAEACFAIAFGAALSLALIVGDVSTKTAIGVGGALGLALYLFIRRAARS